VGGGTAFVGFTGGTNGLTATQDILDWTYSATSPTKPAVVSNVQATTASGTQVNLTWTNKGTNQTGFHIDQATNSAFTQNLVTHSASASATSFVDAGLKPGTTYYYRIRATNAAGDSANSITARVTMPTTPAAVSNLNVTSVTTSEVDLSWKNKAANANGIEVFRKVGGNTPILIATLPATATSLKDTGLVVALKPGTTYLYNVQAINTAGPSPVSSVSTTTKS
jgi:predicted phage tail protein